MHGGPGFVTRWSYHDDATRLTGIQFAQCGIQLLPIGAGITRQCDTRTAVRKRPWRQPGDFPRMRRAINFDGRGIDQVQGLAGCVVGGQATAGARALAIVGSIQPPDQRLDLRGDDASGPQQTRSLTRQVDDVVSSPTALAPPSRITATPVGNSSCT